MLFPTLSYITIHPELLFFLYKFSSGYYFLQSFHVRDQYKFKTFNIQYNYKLTTPEQFCAQCLLNPLTQT